MAWQPSFRSLSTQRVLALLPHCPTKVLTAILAALAGVGMVFSVTSRCLSGIAWMQSMASSQYLLSHKG